MSTAILDATLMEPAIRFIEDTPEAHLSADIQELVSLRHYIVLNARWEASEHLADERRDELRTELEHLRWLYYEKIDAIAMTYGVAEAMKAKEDVERSVKAPREMKLPKRLLGCGLYSH